MFIVYVHKMGCGNDHLKFRGVTRNRQKELTLVVAQDPGRRERCPLAEHHILVRTLSGQPDRNVFDKDKG